MLASAHNVMTAAFARTVAPRKPMTVSQWAAKHRVLSGKGSAEAGPWRNDRNPPQVEIMDCCSARSPVTDIVAILPIQFGKSEIEMNILGYTMTENPMPIMLALPAEVSMNKLIDQKLNPLIETTPAVQKVLVSLASRETSNRRTFKDFEGGQLYIEHAGNPVRLKSTSVGLVLADEFSSFASELGSGDDPVALLDGRTTAFIRAKRFKVGTPETEGSCRLTEAYEKSDKRRFHVPCPECGHKQPLVWAGLQWTPDARQCWYCCNSCGAVIHEHQKTEMIAAGEWVPEHPEIPHRGYRANCLYYPVGLGPTWLQLVHEFLAAVGDPAKLKTFVNDRLAEAWQDKASKNLKANLLRDRAEPYRLRRAPHGVLGVTAGVDTQDNRLAVQIVGWGRGLVCWVLDYIELPGDPAEPEVWDALTELINRPIQHASGAMLRVEATAIDMFGHRTEDVKNFGRSNRIRRALVTFGARSANAPVLGRGKLVDVNWQGKLDPKGVHIYQIGSIDITHRLYAWLGADADKEPDQRRVHFSDDLDDDFLGGLISEVWNPRKGRYEKKRGAPRNEPLDTWKLAYAATHHPELRLHRLAAAGWDSRETSILGSAAELHRLDSRGTPALLQTPQTPPDDSRGTTQQAAEPEEIPLTTVRSVAFEVVALAERNPEAIITAHMLARWTNVTRPVGDEVELHAGLMRALDPGASIGASITSDLLDLARRYLAGLSAAHDRPQRRRPVRGMRSRGL